MAQAPVVVERAVAPHLLIHPKDVQVQANQFDGWLREVSHGYVTLERLKGVAGMMPIVGNLIAAGDVIVDLYELTLQQETNAFDWIGLGIDAIGVIPAAGNVTAPARTTLRPIVHYVRRELMASRKAIQDALGDALIAAVVAHVQESHAGEIEQLIEKFDAALEQALTAAKSWTQQALNDLAHAFELAADGKLFNQDDNFAAADRHLQQADAADWYNPMKVVHGAAFVLELAGAGLEISGNSALKAAVPDHVKKDLLAFASTVRKQYVPMVASQFDKLKGVDTGSIKWLLMTLLTAIRAWRKAGKDKLSAAVPANQSGKSVKKNPQHHLESSRGQAKPNGKGPNGCKECRTGGTATGHSVGFALGEELLTHTDFSLPGVLPLTWSRTYRSRFAAMDDGPLGARWVTPFTTRLDVAETGLTYHDAAGRSHSYPLLNPGQSHHDSVENLTLSVLDDQLLTIARGHELAELYERHGAHYRLAQLRDRSGNHLTLDYSPDGQLTRILSSDGQTIQLQHDSHGRITALDLLGQGTAARTLARYQYSPDGDLEQATDEEGSVRRYAYRSHLLTRYTDRTGRGIHLEWDGDHLDARCTREYADDGSDDTRLRYHPNLRLTYVTDALGQESRYYYDIDGYTYRIVHADGLEEWRYRDANKNLTSHLHPDGSTDQYRYDERDNLIEQLRADGSLTVYAYDQHDQLIQITDPMGQVWKRGYDSRGNLTEETDPLGQTTRYRYTEQGLPSQIEDAKGGIRKLDWRPDGQLASYTDCSGKVSRWHYDERGRLTEEIDALGQTTRYRYAAGQLAERILPDGSSERFEHDAEGRLLAHTDAKGQTTRYSHDRAGRIQQRTDAHGGKFSYQYDRLGRLTSLTNANGAQYRFAYDPAGRLTRETGFDGKTTDYRYDPANGRLTAQLDAGQRIELAYDPAGRLIERKVDTAGGTSSETYAYDAAGRLAEARNRYSRLNWHYDPAGNLIREQQRYDLPGQIHAGQINYEWTHEYDPLGTRIATRRPDGQRIDWLVYGSGHVHGLQWNGQELVQFERDDLHRETHRQLASRLVQQTRYDPLGRITQQSMEGRSLQRRDYRYDALGQLLGIQDSRKGDTSYRYDPLGRLEMAASAKHLESFHYDPAGNIVDAPASTLGSQVATLTANLLKQYAGSHYQYDARGNLSQKQRGTDTTRYRWDAFNRLEALLNSQGETRYYYDPLGRRIAKEAPKQTTVYGWDGDLLAFEQTDANTTHYLYEPGGFVPLAQVCKTQAGDTIHYYHCDHLGTPQEMSDAQGELAWSAHYQAWGQVEEVLSDAARKAGIKNPLRFQGQYYDEESGLHYNRHRYYDPEVGRYISQDPIGLAGGEHLYAYAPTPTGWIDPLGLSSSCPLNCGCGGTAIVRHYDTGSRTGHYTVEVKGAQRNLHTHQVITGDTSTTIIDEGRRGLMEGDPILHTAEIPLKDAGAAQAYQQSQLGKDLGTYSERTNSCVDHVANVLRAGGVDVPSGPLGQTKFLTKNGFKIKVR